MTQHRILEDRLASLSDSGEIIRSMKNLAFMETRKLTRLIEHQRGVVAQIDAVAADFLAFFPHTLPPAASSHRAYLVIGSRRGFCGDLNERLVARLRQEVADSSASGVTIIGVGHKLCRRLQPGLDLGGLQPVVRHRHRDHLIGALDPEIGILLTRKRNPRQVFSSCRGAHSHRSEI